MTTRIYEVEILRIAGRAFVRVEADSGEDHEYIVAPAISRCGDPDVVAAFDRDEKRNGRSVQEREIRVVARVER